MVRRVDRDEVRPLAAAGAHVVDVLPRRVYRDLHIAGAPNIPLGELDRKAAEELRRNDPIDPESVACAVFTVLARRVTEGEIEDVKHVLPAALRSLWPEADKSAA